MSSSSSQSSSSLKSHSNRDSKPLLRGNIVLRQELKSYTPNCNIKFAIFSYVILIILFLAFGLPILIISSKIIEVSMDFTDCLSLVCSHSFTVNDTISPPIYLYYEIDNFYSNHRYYQKSKVVDQLRGRLHVDSLGNIDCKGAIYVYEMFDNDTSKYHTYTGESLKAEDYANPCGLIAKSYYNDTNFHLNNTRGEDWFINETYITNAYDRKFVFGQIANSTSIQWINVIDEHFIVWMQMEAFDNFRKLWGRIDKGMPKGKYKLHFKNNWNVTRFKGKKKMIVSNSSLIGTGMFFGFVLCGGAFFCIIMLLVILICETTTRKRVYTTQDLKWD